MSQKLANTSHKSEKVVHKIGNMSQCRWSLFKNIFFVQV